jgi:ABC-type methionine transport system ATPase subunit
MTPFLEMESVSVRHEEASLLDEVSFRVDAGAALGIVGPEGCGKSILLRVCMGITFPSSGTVRLQGRSLAELPDRELRRMRAGIGYLPERGGLLANLSLEANILLPLHYHNRMDDESTERARELMRGLNIERFADRIPAEAPGEIRLRAVLARALAGRPRLLVADQPLEGLTDETSEMIVGRIERARREWNTTILLTGHRRDSVKRLADRILLINNGRLTPVDG